MRKLKNEKERRKLFEGLQFLIEAHPKVILRVLSSTQEGGAASFDQVG